MSVTPPPAAGQDHQQDFEPFLPLRPLTADGNPQRLPAWLTRRRLIRAAIVGLAFALLLVLAGFFGGRWWLRSAMRDSLPQVDGSLAIPGLAAPVTVVRDAQGVPHIHASSMDDLLMAQGFVTAQDRLFQMDLLRRHAAGTLAEVLGRSAVAHDRLQRTLQVRAAADRALAQLPPGQLHTLQRYADGVNAAIAVDGSHLPVEFRMLRYQPAPWAPRDSLLVTLAMFEDLTNAYAGKLAREALEARLPAAQRDELVQDLYPVGSWRDHPPTQPVTDLTIEGPPIEDVPLDESQSLAQIGAPFIAPHAMSGVTSVMSETSAFNLPAGTDLSAGSNDWVVSGAHTASGKPLLSNDMHLTHNLPGIWYEADLASAAGPNGQPFHCAGVALPGVPLIVVGYNDHIAWGFTNVGADVQDLYLETLRGSGSSAQFQAVDGSWQPVVRIPEPIKVHGADDIPFEVLATRHGNAVTPILNPVLLPAVTAPGGHPRVLSLRWTIYDPAVVNIPTLAVDSAQDWPSFLAAFRDFGGPSHNVVYADDQGHIGYHTMGMIPLRGAAPSGAPKSASADTANQQTALLSGPLSPVPVVPSPANEWTGYIPFDALPQTYDPPGGVIATANARITPDDYVYPITLNWGAAYRTERIYHLLAHSKGLTPASMLSIQTDVYSDFDHVLAQRLTYAVDHAALAKFSSADQKTLHQAADLLRSFNGRMTVDSPAAAVVAAVHKALWTALLSPKLNSADGRRPTTTEINALYTWAERDYALEQIVMHTPARWLSPSFANWSDFMAGVVIAALHADIAPADLARWRYGSSHVVDIEHPLFEQSALLRDMAGIRTGTGPQPQSGDHTTIKQVDTTFGPSERFTADLANLDGSTLNLVTGQSGNPLSAWFLDQFPAWYHGTTYPLPYSDPAVTSAAKHTLTLRPE